MNRARGTCAVRRALCLAAISATIAPRARAGDTMHELSLDPDALARLQAAIDADIGAGRLPGAVLRIGQDGRAWQRAFGRKALLPAAEPLSEDTVYDLASLTKAMVTAPVLMRLVEGGALDLDSPVRKIVPAFDGAYGITVRQLLTHSSGLPASLPLDSDWRGADTALALACASRPTHAPDSFFRYSDINYILLGEIAQRLGGQSLDALADAWIFRPLGMADTGYRPLRRHAATRIAPTELDGGGPLRGVVHDPTARRMDGVAGHAGIFGTAADVGRYASMLLNGGALDGVQVLKESSVARMMRDANPASVPARRGLGFDIDSPYSRPRGARFPVGSVGHTGFTGCVLWLNPGTRSYHVFLSNRVHPTTRESIVALYEEVGTRVAQALGVPPR